VVNVLANTPLSYDRLGARLDNAALLNAAGVSVMFTSGETQNARRLRQMAGNAVAHGMPWMAALAAITRVPGEIWRLQSGTGTLAERAPADLVIWSGDPLELSTWAERVMIDGQWQDLSSRQTRLFERYRDLQSDHYYRNPDR
jgi:imidazolonepropionase-like amidohydrolase